jgi:inosine triphosphate pyrophosphatase
MAPKRLNFVTGNKNKLLESKAILGDIVDLQSRSLDLVEIQGTIEEISADKCRRAAEAVGTSRLIFSTKFTVLRSTAPFLLKIHVFASTHLKSFLAHICGYNSSRGRAWIELTLFSKWFLEALDLKGLNDLLAGFPDKSAQAVCTFAYCEGPGHEPVIFQGRTDVSL